MSAETYCEIVVPSRPLFHSAIFRSEEGRDAALFERGLEFYPLGRHALLAALLRVGVRPGDTIVFPALYCESTLRVLRDYGFRLKYVDVGQDLRLDENGVASLCNGSAVKALVIVHYFGLRAHVSTRLLNACRSNGIHVIEDYSHSFLSFELSKTQAGNASAFVFSMRKTVPVPDGGALLMCMPGGAKGGDGPGARTPARVLAYVPFLVRGYVEALCIRVGWPNLYGKGMDEIKRLADRLRGRAEKTMSGTVGEPAPVRPSLFLRRMLRDRDLLEEIAARRRGNYQRLCAGLRGIDGIELVAPDVADGVPFVCPILVSAAGLLGHLRRSGIGAFRWPGEDMPLEVKDRAGCFPAAIGVNERIVCMPVHQDVSGAQVSYMVDAVGNFFKQQGHAGRP